MSNVGIENMPPTSEASREKSTNPVKASSTEDNLAKTSSAGKSVSAASSGKQGRKTLQTLQPSGKNQALLVGADGVLRLGSTGKREIKIYQDPAVPPTCSTPVRTDKLVQATVTAASVQTQVEDRDTAQYRAEQMMYGAEEDLPLEYWKDLAEKRREALEVSLTENEELHTSLSLLEEEKERIKAEAETYKSLAEQAQELAKILNNLVSDSEDEDSEDRPEKKDKNEDLPAESKEQKEEKDD